MKEKTCCFIGHRKIAETEKVKAFLRKFLVGAVKTGFTRFIFGSRGDFNYICHDVVTELKKDFPEIVRVAYLTKHDGCPFSAYEEVYRPDFVYQGGKAVYVERNRYIIDISDHCVFYYDKDYKPLVKYRSSKYIDGLSTSGSSGTFIAYRYALKKKKSLINVFELI